ncbi:MAG: hypothetical protein NVSMB26_05270 [Beijerinckiaceae bacterium]
MKTALGLSALMLALSFGLATAEEAAPNQKMGGSDPTPNGTMAPLSKGGTPSEAGSPPASSDTAAQHSSLPAKPQPGSGTGFASVTERPTHEAHEAVHPRRQRWARAHEAYEARGYGHRHSFRYGWHRLALVYSQERRDAYRAGYRRGLASVGYFRRTYHVPRYAYVQSVRYAYARTPFAYDYPRETYATGIFPTVSAIGLHTYDYGYTTQIRPIAAYGGATGSYAGGYPIYNRPLAPAYPTPSCNCD